MAVTGGRAKGAKSAKSAKAARARAPKAQPDNSQEARDAKDVAARLKGHKDFRSAARPEGAGTRYPHPSDQHPVPESIRGIPVVGETGDGQRWILEDGQQENK